MPAEPVRDSITIAGIPEAELTPKVRYALTGLMEEVNALRVEVDELQSRLADAEVRADNDPLLGIPNRRAFVRDLSRALAMADRYQNQAALVFIDLNDLKMINDLHGHAAGDAALLHLSNFVAKNIRTVDSFGRIGGDEFGLILMNANLDLAQKKVEWLIDTIATVPLKWKDETLALNMACGIVEVTAGQTLENTLEKADKAMYADKLKYRK